jgi:hypothetical protein
MADFERFWSGGKAKEARGETLKTGIDLLDRFLALINFRKRWIVNPPLQLRMMALGSSVAIASLAAAFGGATYVLDRSQTAMIEAGLPPHHPMFAFLAEQEKTLGAVFVIIAVIALAVGMTVGLWISHRVAGPIYRMRRHLEEAAAGRAPKPIRFRKDDYFQELADAYNEELITRGRIRRPGTEEHRQDRDDQLLDRPPANREAA